LTAALASAQAAGDAVREERRVGREILRQLR